MTIGEAIRRSVGWETNLPCPYCRKKTYPTFDPPYDIMLDDTTKDPAVVLSMVSTCMECEARDALRSFLTRAQVTSIISSLTKLFLQETRLGSDRHTGSGFDVVESPVDVDKAIRHRTDDNLRSVFG